MSNNEIAFIIAVTATVISLALREEAMKLPVKTNIILAVAVLSQIILAIYVGLSKW